MVKRNHYFYNSFFFYFLLAIPHIVNGKLELLPLIKTGCSVIFHKYEPLDLEACPYIIMVIKNTHTHTPPPPHQAPNHLQQDLKKLIDNSNDLLIDSTPRKLISGNNYIFYIILIFFNFN
jgi:hypothetical protein